MALIRDVAELHINVVRAFRLLLIAESSISEYERRRLVFGDAVRADFPDKSLEEIKLLSIETPLGPKAEQCLVELRSWLYQQNPSCFKEYAPSGSFPSV
jgi:hypothetical protein